MLLLVFFNVFHQRNKVGEKNITILRRGRRRRRRRRRRRGRRRGEHYNEKGDENDEKSKRE